MKMVEAGWKLTKSRDHYRVQKIVVEQRWQNRHGYCREEQAKIEKLHKLSFAPELKSLWQTSMMHKSFAATLHVD